MNYLESSYTFGEFLGRMHNDYTTIFLLTFYYNDNDDDDEDDDDDDDNKIFQIRGCSTKIVAVLRTIPNIPELVLEGFKKQNPNEIYFGLKRINNKLYMMDSKTQLSNTKRADKEILLNNLIQEYSHIKFPNIKDIL